MIVQTYFPQKLSPSRYDAYLASGWFRGSMMLYKMDLLCIEEDLFSVINIRLDLDGHTPKKRHLKLLNKAKKNFTFEINQASSSLAKEMLYQMHKSKFQGFIHSTLEEYLNSGFSGSVFDTQEVCIYHDNELIAVSFFDLGGQSAASLLCLYNQEYSSYSLGTVTMLLEIEFIREKNFKWYYPGYVLDRKSSFDYKLQLGTFEYYNHNKRWINIDKFELQHSLAHHINSKTEEMSAELLKKGIKHKVQLYPFYSLGYMGYWKVDFLQFPRLIVVQKKKNLYLIIAYDFEREKFTLLEANYSSAHDHLINMECSSDFLNSDSYFMQLVALKNVLHRSIHPNSIVKNIIKLNSNETS